MTPTPDDSYLDQLRSLPFQPIFILGLHRSGTSILYKMLTATGCFNPVTAHHLINYYHLLTIHEHQQEDTVKQLLTHQLHQQGSMDRGIDHLKLTAEFAEEYGFHLNRYTSHMQLTSSNLPYFIEFCQKIQFLAHNHKPILLKNPFDFPNFLFIIKHFPTAKIIFIHRHPYKTISSILNTLLMLFSTKNPYTTLLSRIYTSLYSNLLTRHLLRLCFTHLSFISLIFFTWYSTKSTRYYLRNITKLSKQTYLSLTYENLCTQPQKTMETILRFLQCTPHQTQNFNSFIKPRNPPLHPVVRKFHCFIYAWMKPYCTALDYQPDSF